MRKILTNKFSGGTTYLETGDVDGFFLAGASPADFDVTDEAVESYPELIGATETAVSDPEPVVSDISPELTEEQRVVIYGEPEAPTASEVTNA